jgi:electron transfer flavoprotein beta subunit
MVCVVKFVPDVDSFSYDYAQDEVRRDQVRMVLNPDDVCAVSFALKMKEQDGDSHIEVVTMAPRSVKPHMEDLLRLDIDEGTIISDPAFAGSDTYATSTILGKYLESRKFDCLLTGTRSLDGATSHVPAQLAEVLGMDQMQDIIAIESLDSAEAVFTIEDEQYLRTYAMGMPGILALARASGYALPYIAYEDFDKDVSDKLTFVTNATLHCAPDEIGLSGSLTQVVHTYAKHHHTRAGKIVHTDDAGIDAVHSFLEERGYV